MWVTVLNLKTGESFNCCKAQVIERLISSDKTKKGKPIQIIDVDTLDNWQRQGNIKFWHEFIIAFNTTRYKMNYGKHMKLIGNKNLLSKLNKS
jgi:hypothetical protein